MQYEVNEKVVALSIKTSKLTAEVLQKAMKAVLAKGKQQLSKTPHGKITMRQLMENMTAALPDMDADMRELAKRTLSKVGALTDEEYAGLAVYAADEA